MTVETRPQAGRRPEGGVQHSGSIGLRSYVLVIGQLALLTLLLRQFQIESAAFLRLALLTFAGFAIHALLPLRHRLAFFLALSLASIVVVLNLDNALWIVGIGLVLIAICHLPISFRWRIAVLAVAGAALTALRARWIEGPMSDAIWPILGSMFMFRVMVYLYDLRHDSTIGSPVRTLSYFFMLPNACFPLFPVVDSSAFRRNYFDDDAYVIYQRGIDWMVRGVIHLLLYRYIYYNLALAPSEVTGPEKLIQYVIANFLLYLRVSGLFHLIVGMLHLFGFRLPETHHKYLLAASFTDFWRRINIYWKDFMQKVFYYPAVFRLKSLGMTRAMVLATVWVFLLTWALHAYQWFWLRGALFLIPQDMMFWAILGLLVVANGLIELRYGRKRRLAGTAVTWRDVAVRVAKTYGMFWFICVLWSFWTAESLRDWIAMFSALAGNYTAEVLFFPVIVLLVIVLGSIEQRPASTIKNAELPRRNQRFAQAVTVVSMVLLIAVSREEVNTQFGPEFATTVHSLRSGRLSRLDNAKLERGYYENLLSVDRFNSQLWEVYSKKPAQWLDVRDAGLKRFTGDFAQTELIPSFVAETNFGPISINRWGMRDQDYEQTPRPGTFRVAVLGPSTVMGWGARDGETFEALLEARLNRERADAQHVRYEVLNFGVPGYQPPQQLIAIEKALRFHPNTVFYVAAGREVSRAADYLVEVVRKGIAIPYAPLADIVKKAGLTPTQDEAAALRRLTPYREELLGATYGQIVARTRSQGAVPVLVFLPQVRAGTWQEETPEILRIARAAGFIVLDLSDVFAGEDLEAIRVAEWDDHPNAKGHRLLAERLYADLTTRPDIIPGTSKQQSALR
jgi:D-alanyl-lipoteichoic acid acyltransferase DltB (MBOAT superfamily)